MIIGSFDSGPQALATFAMLYVGLIGFYAWRILNLIQAQRAAELQLRLRIAQRHARALRPGASG